MTTERAAAEAPAASSDSRLTVRVLVILGFLSAMGPLSIDMYLPSLPAVARDLDARPASVQLTLTACTVGLGLGQLFVGPLSDAFGRRRPMAVGIGIFSVFSLACALTSSLPALVVFRLLQALGGSAGLVVSRAVARDLRSGARLARLFAMLMLVNGTAPILAPVIGAQLVRVTSWRGVFWVLGLVGVLLVAGIVFGLPETLPKVRRRPPGLGRTFRVYRTLLSDRVFVSLVLTGAFAFATMFSYISASPFVLEDRFGLTPQQFSLVFAVNALGIMAASQLVRLRIRPPHAVLIGLCLAATGATLAAIGLLTAAGLPAVLAGFFLITSGYGALAPSVIALALADHPEAAGSASAIYGATQFLIGGALAPIAGLGQSAASGVSSVASSAPLAATLTGLAFIALTLGIRAVGRVRCPLPATAPEV